MRTARPAMHGVPSSTRDGWGSLEHRVLKRRSTMWRAGRGRHSRAPRQVRDAFDTHGRDRLRLARLRGVGLTALVTLAVADLVFDCQRDECR
jgi:hypothetical protein